MNHITITPPVGNIPSYLKGMREGLELSRKHQQFHIVMAFVVGLGAGLFIAGLIGGAA